MTKFRKFICYVSFLLCQTMIKFYETIQLLRTKKRKRITCIRVILIIVIFDFLIVLRHFFSSIQFQTCLMRIWSRNTTFIVRITKKNIIENSDRCRLLQYSSNQGLAHNIFGSLIRRRVLKGSSRCRSLSRLGRLRLRRCIGSQKRRSIWLEPGKVREIWGSFLVRSFLCVAYVIML